MLEPWDGPASIVFTDGRQIGATLDRNGLRPSRYCITDDDLVIMGSESGVLPMPENKIVRKWRLQPGKMFLIDLEQGRMIDDEELKANLVNTKPYKQWIENLRIKLDSIEAVRKPAPPACRAHRCPAGPPAGLWLHPGRHQVPDGAHGQERRGRHWLHGQRQPAGRAVGQEQAAVQLLQAAVRPGDEPADRPDPRSHRDVAQQLHRPQAQPAGHQPGQPADAAGSEPAVLDFADMAKLRDIERHTQRQVQAASPRHHLPAGWGREGVEAKLASLCAQAVDAIKGGKPTS
jgi:glutamate synthase (NADPH/NADH) large chain